MGVVFCLADGAVINCKFLIVKFSVRISDGIQMIKSFRFPKRVSNKIHVV